MKGQKTKTAEKSRDVMRVAIEDLAFLGSRHYRQFLSYAAIEREFDRWAFGSPGTNGFTYDDIAQVFEYNAPQKLATLLFPLFNRFPEKPLILDVGCGTGKSGWPYIEKEYVVDGIDLSEKMVRAAQERGYRTVLKHNIAEPVPIQTKYDVALSIGMICEYISPSIAISHIAECLKERAAIAIASEMLGSEWAQIKHQLHPLGFELTSFTLGLGYRPINGFQKMYTYIVATRGL